MSFLDSIGSFFTDTASTIEHAVSSGASSVYDTLDLSDVGSGFEILAGEIYHGIGDAADFIGTGFKDFGEELFDPSFWSDVADGAGIAANDVVDGIGDAGQYIGRGLKDAAEN